MLASYNWFTKYEFNEVISYNRSEHNEYMSELIGFVQALIETCAIGVLDVQTFKLCTSEDGTVWLHTGGMRKFGRPDISIVGVGEDEIEHAA